MFIAVSHTGGVAERSNAAVLELIVGIALGCRDWHLFRNSGTGMQGGEPSGTGVGIGLASTEPHASLAATGPSRKRGISPTSRAKVPGVKRWGTLLIALGALLTAFVLVPVLLIESGELLTVTSSYVLMMLVPATLAVVLLVYQRSRGLDLASVAVALLVGVVISTIPFWGPNLDPGMKMPLGWIGTILGHYVAGAIVLLGGVLQVGALRSRPSEPLPA